MANVTGWYAEVSASVTAPRMSATALLKPPVVSSVSPFIVAPPRMSASAAMPTPVLGFSTTLTVPRMSATAAMPVPTVANYVNAAVTAPRMAATATMATPAVAVSYSVTAPRMAASAALAVPMVTASGGGFADDFNRTNSSTLGASWNTDSGFGVSLTVNSNAAVSGSTSPCASIYGTPMLTGNNEITVVMKGTPATNDRATIIARSDSATSLAATTKLVEVFMIQNQPWTIYRYGTDPTGVSTPGNQSWANGDTITFTCVGATLMVKKNGTTILTTGGSTDLAAGYVELLVYSPGGAGIGFDSFTAQDI